MIINFILFASSGFQNGNYLIERIIRIQINNRYNRPISLMRKFEIRFADTGYPHIIDQVSSIESLKQKIFKECKIEKNNQRLLSKKGNIITGNDRLDNENIMKKTFSGDANNPTSVNEVMGMYLFNHKELLKNTPEQRSIQQQSRNVLIKKHENFMTLRTKIFELEPFSKRFAQQQIQKIATFNPILIPMAQQWHNSVSEVINLRENFKETQACFDEYIQRWENQRKALIVLTKNIEILITEKRGPIQKLSQNLQSLKKKFEQEYVSQISLSSSLNQSSSSILYRDEVKSVKQSIDSLKKKTSNLNLLYNNIFKKSTTFRRNIKQTHIDLQKEIKKIDEFKKKKSQQIEQIQTEMKQNYLTLVDAMREKLDAKSQSKLAFFLSERKNIDSRIQKLRREAREYVSQMQNKFVQMYAYYIQHQGMVRSEYRIYNEIYMDIEQNLKQHMQTIQTQIYNLHKRTHDLSKQQPDPEPQPQPSKPLKQLEQAEYKRRYIFNNKLLCLQQQIKQILKEEENNRKKYMEDIISIHQMYDNSVLGNVRVPCFLLNFDQSSDRDIVGLGRSLGKGAAGKENFGGFDDVDVGMYKASTGMDRILKQLEIIKQCHSSLKSDSTVSQKQKNLQTLLQKSSQIFHRIYTHKVALLSKQHQQQSQFQQKRIQNLEKQNKELKQKIQICSQNFNVNIDNRKQLQDCIQSLKLELDQVINRSLDMEKKFQEYGKQCQGKLRDAENKVRMYQGAVEDSKKEIGKLKVQKKEMEERLSMEVSNTMETLLIQLQKSSNSLKQLQQLNHEYKIVMGDQAIKIATLETQLTILKQQNQSQLGKAPNDDMKRLQNSFYGNNAIGNEGINRNENIKIQMDQGRCMEDDMSELTENLRRVSERSSLKSCENLQQAPLLNRNSRSLKSQELKELQKQISKLEKQIEELKEENEGLTTENQSLNQQIMKIAMKQTQDQQIQTQSQLPNHSTQLIVPNLSTTVQPIPNIQITNPPQIGQTRIFMPFSPGIYICLTSQHRDPAQQQLLPTHYLTSQSRNYLNIHQSELANQQYQQSNNPYILDMNCLSGKARQLLTQCTLIVVLKVTKILPALDKFYVEGDVVSAAGFEDDDMIVKDYAALFK